MMKLWGHTSERKLWETSYLSSECVPRETQLQLRLEMTNPCFEEGGFLPWLVPGYGGAHSSGSPPPSYLSQQDRGRGSQECELATLYTRGERSSREQGRYEDFLRSLHNTNTTIKFPKGCQGTGRCVGKIWNVLLLQKLPSLLNCGPLKGEVI